MSAFLNGVESMSRYLSFLLSFSVLSLAPITPALAQVTAAELWNEWQAQGAVQGQTLVAEEAIETDTGLILNGVSTTMAGADTMAGLAQVDTITLTNNRDGTVNIEMSQPYTIDIAFPADAFEDGSPPVTIEILMTYEGLEIVAGGTVGERTYDYTADTLTLTDGEITGGSEPLNVNFSLVMNGLDATDVVDGRNLENIVTESVYALENLIIAFDAAPEDRSQGNLKFNLSMDDIAFEGGGNIGSFASYAEFDVFPENFDVSGVFEYAGLTYDVDLNDDTSSFQMAYTNAGGAMEVDVSTDEIAYGLTANGTEVHIEGSDIPMPIDVTSESAEFSFAFPIAASEDLADATLRIAYEDITMGDPIWALFDPGEFMARDPITLVADVSAQLQVLVDLMTYDPAETDGDPIELRGLRINEILLAALGAELTGTGDFEFMQNPIFPQPVGVIDLRASGVMALLDRLQDSGILPSENVLMVRGLIGGFTRPGSAPDTLETNIEFTEDGRVTANGLELPF